MKTMTFILHFKKTNVNNSKIDNAQFASEKDIPFWLILFFVLIRQAHHCGAFNEQHASVQHNEFLHTIVETRQETKFLKKWTANCGYFSIHIVIVYRIYLCIIDDVKLSVGGIT